MVDSCKKDNLPLACAAPKLVDFANEKRYVIPYHMTEVWFNPKLYRRRLSRAPKYSTIHWKGHTREEILGLWLKIRK